MNQKIYLNDDWLFLPDLAENLSVDALEWHQANQVRIPHTVVETPYNYFDAAVYQMVSAYKRVLIVTEDMRKGHLLLTFEGAAHDATVYVNGKKAARHFGGYTAFTVDIMPYLSENCEQELVVILDSRESLNQPPFGNVIDYMTYGGIYRDVYMEVKAPVYIEDIYAATPDVRGEQKALTVDLTLNELSDHLTVCGRVESFQVPEGEEKQIFELDEENIRFKTSCLQYHLEGPMLWELEAPYLYVLTLELKKDGQVIDQKSVRFGFREVSFEVDGFYLNGEKIKLRGLNRHQSWPYVGYAMPKNPQQLDADLLKYELGCNLVRTSHYPQSQYFIDRCDEIGLLVFTEIPGWQHIGDTKWKKIAVRHVREMIMQYRNHPSIILWGVRINESLDDDAFYYKTNQLAHELDIYRQTGGVRCIRQSHLYEDVYTYNDFSHEGTRPGTVEKYKVTDATDHPYMITEYGGHMYPTKPWDDEAHRTEHALRHARVLNSMAADDEIAGATGWCMFDYNTHKDFGSGDYICYHGVLDMFRNPKLAAAVYKSQTDDVPVCEISSTMDIGEHAGGLLQELYAFTNADCIELYKGDDYIQTFYPDEENFGALDHPPIKIDDFIGDALEKNEGFDPKSAYSLKQMFKEMQKQGRDFSLSLKTKLAAFAKTHRMTIADIMVLYSRYVREWGRDSKTWTFLAHKDGEVVSKIVKKSAAAVHIRVTTDHQQLVEENSYDVATVLIEAIDDHGQHLPYYQEPLLFETKGDIELIGPKMVSMHAGFAGTYVKSKGQNGTGQLIIHSAIGQVSIAYEIRIK